MKEGLKRKIDNIIYKIVFCEDSSINQKVWELSEYFNRYDWKEILPEIFPFLKPEPKEIKDMIYNCYKVDSWLQIDIFNKYSEQITGVMINELEINLINT